jgi:23S rRNA (pseudouridine1915-N3)-methyltransferase
MMQIQLIAVGKKIPSWVEQGYHHYARRLPKECALTLIEISAVKRNKNSNTKKIINEEGQKILAALATKTAIVTLDILGKTWTTIELSHTLKHWLASGQNIALIIGGADGLAESVKLRAQQSWSLSPLTFPHPLVRVLVAEQIYRAWSLLQNHPYHRS